MTKLAKGPNSLTPLIGNELGQNPPPWETIQGQTKEYAQVRVGAGQVRPAQGGQGVLDQADNGFRGVGRRARPGRHCQEQRNGHGRPR